MSESFKFINKLDEHRAKIAGSDPEWLNELRTSSIVRFNEVGLPTVKNEEWKYTNISSITKNTYQVSSHQELKEIKEFEQFCSDKDINIVFVNGIFSDTLSNLDNLPSGLKINNLTEAINSNGNNVSTLLSHYKPDTTDTFVALNNGLFQNGSYIQISDNAVIQPTIHIIHVTSHNPKKTILFPRSLIVAGKSCQANIIESHVAFNHDAYLNASVTDIFIDENANIRFCKLQNESPKADHISATRVHQQANSNLNNFIMTLKGNIIRNNLDIVLNGEGSHATLNGLYTIENAQHVDNHTSVNHKVPNCTSSQLYKGILNDKARAVFNGKIFVQPIAQQTNSYQLNKNLLLGKDCRVDTKPQLEIGADDVKCTHGATIGQLEEDQLFYLQTRSISRDHATRMLCRGFVDEIIATIGETSIQSKFSNLLTQTYTLFK